MNLVRRPRSARVVLSSALTLIAVLALAACGSDSKSSTSTDGSSSSSTSASSAPASTGDAVIKTADHGDLGTILVDADGKTVYTLSKEDQPVACTDACLAAWPPVLIPAGTDKATGSDGVTGALGLVSAADGKQVAHDGFPLYTFSGDSAAGDANGEGLASFGGVWHVVTVSGGGASSDTSSTTSDSGY
jgi:predicted lipoprotein with Yx(FWY)xxD motif